jgi:hypothetical protein
VQSVEVGGGIRQRGMMGLVLLCLFTSTKHNNSHLNVKAI